MYCITKWFQFDLSFYCWSLKVYFWCSEISENKTNGIDLCWWRHKCNKWVSMRDVNSSFSGPECNKLFAGATTHACRWKEWEEIYQWRGRERVGGGESAASSQSAARRRHSGMSPCVGPAPLRSFKETAANPTNRAAKLMRIRSVLAHWPTPNLICISNITWVGLIDQNQSG